MVAINAGVERFWTMQTPQGGLGYWPGDSAPLRWGSAYAAWILALARALSQPAKRRRYIRERTQPKRGLATHTWGLGSLR
jgi:hypothetical protein